MFSRIVVPLDGSPFGETALRFATAIAGTAGATLELVHVHIPPHFDAAPESITAFRYQDLIGFEAAVDEAVLHREADDLAERAARLRLETGIAVTSRVVRGRVGPALEHEAEAFDADLIVMATHARGGYERARLGSVGDTVARFAGMPVLFVRPEDDAWPTPAPAFRSVLVPLDGSPFSEQILEPALAIARLFRARLSIFHLVHYSTPRLHLSPKAIPDLERAAEGAATDYVDALVDRIAGSLPAVEGEILRSGQPAAAILDAARRHDADLVAMATHGRGGVNRLLFGSTTDAVLQASHRPMLVARPHAIADALAVPAHA